ncbi:MAG: AAA family ATPase [Chitinivibrionales bacterium]|nr:AAA family ATPase [Chitinivibrionales bacterium]MBD3357455.1 AAA family ATPase [Chitinivibrionales bacterium]
MKKKRLRLPENVTYLCIEGVIGVGKTTLSQLLAEEFNARIVLEYAEENPFLSDFYQDRSSLAFQTQLWFLLSRYRQLTETSVQQDLFHACTVSDYMFAKDRIFATVNLDENELALYNTIAGLLEREIPSPDFVVYLQASTDVLLERIEKRSRSFEHNMDRRYIETLSQAYNHFFFHYTRTPLLIINTNDIDFVNNRSDFEEIVEQICQTRAGTNYYHPLGSGSGGKNGDKKFEDR